MYNREIVNYAEKIEGFEDGLRKFRTLATVESRKLADLWVMGFDPPEALPTKELLFLGICILEAGKRAAKSDHDDSLKESTETALLLLGDVNRLFLDDKGSKI